MLGLSAPACKLSNAFPSPQLQASLHSTLSSPSRIRSPNMPTKNSTRPTKHLPATEGSTYVTESNTKHEHAQISRALAEGKTENAWNSLCQLKCLPPSPFILNQMLIALSAKETAAGLSKAQSLIRRIEDEKKISFLGSSALGRLAMFSANEGFPVYAEKVVRLMLENGRKPHVKVWSSVVNELGKFLRHFDLAVSLFDDICALLLQSENTAYINPDSSNPKPSNDTLELEKNRPVAEDTHFLMNSVLNAELQINKCNRLRNGFEISEKVGLENVRPDTRAFNAALNACAVVGNTTKADEVLQKMRLFEVRPDVFTFNLMIKLYARVERKDLIAEVLGRMLEENMEPSMSTFYSLVAAYVGLGDLQRAEKLVKAMKDGRRDICSILKGTDVASSEETDDGKDGSASSKPLLLPRIYRPDTRIYTTLMKGYMQSGRLKKVIQTINEMQNSEDSDGRPDHVTYTTAISAFVKRGLMDEAGFLLKEMVSQGIPANCFTYNILLNGYCNIQDMQKAEALFQEMKTAGVDPDVVSYNTMINGFVHGDDNQNAFRYFEDMTKAGVAPSSVTCTTLMKAFARHGQPKEAAKVFEAMQKDVRIRVEAAPWNMLLESYCKAGMVESAKMVFQKMKEHKFYPSVIAYGSLAKCFNLARKPSEALKLWEEVKERKNMRYKMGGIEPLVPDKHLLDTLLEIFVRGALFVKALEIVACMDELRIPVNKTKYKKIFMQYHSMMFTTKYRKLRKFNKRYKKMQQAEAFKLWVGLPSEYHNL